MSWILPRRKGTGPHPRARVSCAIRSTFRSIRARVRGPARSRAHMRPFRIRLEHRCIGLHRYQFEAGNMVSSRFNLEVFAFRGEGRRRRAPAMRIAEKGGRRLENDSTEARRRLFDFGWGWNAGPSGRELPFGASVALYPRPSATRIVGIVLHPDHRHVFVAFAKSDPQHNERPTSSGSSGPGVASPCCRFEQKFGVARRLESRETPFGLSRLIKPFDLDFVTRLCRGWPAGAPGAPLRRAFCLRAGVRRSFPCPRPPSPADPAHFMRSQTARPYAPWSSKLISRANANRERTLD